MFENIATELNNILGSDFIIYLNENATDEIFRTAPPDKVLGVLRVNSGEIKPLKNNQGIEAGCSLALVVPLNNSEFAQSALAQLDNLVTATNGQLAIETDGEEVFYEYIINYKVPRPVGGVDVLNGVKRMTYDVSFNIILTADYVFGDSGNVYISESPLNDGNKAAALLPGVATWNGQSLTNLADDTTVNDYIGKGKRQSAARKLSATIMLMRGSPLHKKIIKNSFNAPDKDYYVGFDMAIGDETVTCFFKAAIERCFMVHPKMQFTTVELLFTEVR